MEKRYYNEESVFLPRNLLREARRQKGITNCPVPKVCILDPDGDIVKHVKKLGAIRSSCWACYHSEMYTAAYKSLEFGIIGCAVGAPYAVLIAEQLFESDCELLISITSAGKLDESISKDYILIEDTIRDEGTSYHYLQPGEKARLASDIRKRLESLLANPALSVQKGRSWTTGAPYRETPSSINDARKNGAGCVEMEASALYAFATAKDKTIVCFAHLTNSMAQQCGDFEKGEENGCLTSLELIHETAWLLI